MKKNFKNKKPHRYVKEIEEWWLDYLKTPPPDDEFNIKEVIPIEVLHLVKRILGIENREKLFVWETEPIPSVKESDNDTIESIIDSEDVKCRSKPSSIKEDDIEKNKAKSYIRFFQRPEYKATIWRENRTLTKDQMSVNQQAEVITESIAKKFVDWVATIGGEEPSSVTVESIIKMFDIGTTMEYATACKVDPQEVSVGKNIKKISEEHRNITLPPTKNPYERYKKSTIEINEEKLETMETVWKGITQLKSTREFLQYLSSNYPNRKPPRYLIEQKTEV